MAIDAEQFDRLIRVRTRRALVTPTLIGLNAAVFIVMTVTGVSPLNPDAVTLVNWGANYGPRTTSVEWWRLLTAMFLHAGVLHLAGESAPADVGSRDGNLLDAGRR